jgi:hypothetical protein
VLSPADSSHNPTINDTQAPPSSFHLPDLLPRGLSVSDDPPVDSVDSSDSSQPSLFTPCEDFLLPLPLQPQLFAASLIPPF